MAFYGPARGYLHTPKHYIINYLLNHLSKNSKWYKKHKQNCIVDLQGEFNQFKINIHYNVSDYDLNDWQSKSVKAKTELEAGFKEIENALQMFNIRNVIISVKHIQRNGLEATGIFMCTLHKDIVRQLIILGKIEGKIKN